MIVCEDKNLEKIIHLQLIRYGKGSKEKTIQNLSYIRNQYIGLETFDGMVNYPNYTKLKDIKRRHKVGGLRGVIQRQWSLDLIRDKKWIPLNQIHEYSQDCH